MGPLEKEVFDTIFCSFFTKEQIALATEMDASDVGVFVEDLIRKRLVYATLTKDYRDMRFTANLTLYNQEVKAMQEEQKKRKENDDARGNAHLYPD